MKPIPCKYCDRLGKIDPISRKALCHHHRAIAYQSRELIKAIAIMNLDNEYDDLIINQKV